MLKSISLEVVGNQRLHCASCEQRVERLLTAMVGVRKVRAEAQNQRIQVLFDTAVLEASAIGERLSEAGYDTRIGNSTSEEIPLSVSNSSSGPRNWFRSLVMIPGAVLPLVPSVTCPACLAAYAGVFSALGLGFLHNERVLAPLIVLFLAVGIFSVAWSTRSHRRLGPLVVTLLGSAAIVLGRLTGHVHILLYGGVALLIAASLWNLWLKRPRRDPLVEIGTRGLG